MKTQGREIRSESPLYGIHVLAGNEGSMSLCKRIHLRVNLATSIIILYLRRTNVHLQ